MGGPQPGLRQANSQGQVMTPQLLQSIRLLQLSTLELEQEVRAALESNVMLEGDTDVEAEVEAPAQEDNDKAAPDADSAEPARIEADFDWNSRESWTAGELPGDEDGEPWTARLADPTPRDTRIEALRQLELTVNCEKQALLCAAIIDAVDDCGYLAESLESLHERRAADVDASLEQWEAALVCVQSVEPTGFAARNLSECLLLQLDAIDDGSWAVEIARRIVREALSDLAARRDAELAERFDCYRADIAEARTLIRSLDPKPGQSLMAVADAVEPEVVISGGNGQWQVTLNPNTLPRVRMNTRYESAVQGAGASKALRDQLNEARWLLRGLEMRHETLLRTSQAIFARQVQFLVMGEEGMAPLNMRDIAEDIQMHESTVCRVVASKHVATPWGVYPLRAFFPIQLGGAEGETSGTAVRAMIRKIIDAEDRSKPLSDGDIAALLSRRGVSIARRTVAKYREGMSIPAAPARQQPAVVPAAA